ncbi:hypothetical protein EYE40_02145 [Glaciihabitans arcticus]|uniref:HTH luxR-type domain-containing protein n=1 Tax=Glaciihabitans arcticus TaxID=2668039 RepID=A0A4Q9GNL0_9MICO|nr:LuxR C-terminal-related transcriptional regulator [Glaciihabitans arcticus]TBN56291.1 hypothetical protein EYE40_02145 [Glaciihabitans arcticus]
MHRRRALDTVLRQLAAGDSAGANETAASTSDDTNDPYLLGLLAFGQFMSQDFELSARTAARALDAAADPAALMLARAAAGLAATGWASEGPDTLIAARDDLALLDGTDPDSETFIRYLLAEGALSGGRLRLSGEFLAASPDLSPDFLATDAGPHPFLTIMRIMRVRLHCFQGRITEAIELGEAARELATETRAELLVDATLCLLRGNAAQKGQVREIADWLERALPDPTDHLSSGCYLLVAFGLIATADVARAARFVLLAGGTPGLDKLTILDRALGLEMLVAAAVSDHDLTSAAAWRERALPLLDDRIARPTIERILSRVDLLSGDAASSERFAASAVEHAQEDDRAIEVAEGEIVLARARIALSRRGAASASLEVLARSSVGSGHLAARQSAARELRSIGRRLRPATGSGFDGLSARERAVALLVVEGFGNQAIAAELHLSEHTVQVHVSRVLAAFGVPSRFALAAQLAPLLPQTTDDAAPPPLTPRQHAVVDHIVLGHSNEQISHQLGVSVKTVEKHVSEVFRRWNVASRIGVSRIARTREG